MRERVYFAVLSVLLPVLTYSGRIIEEYQNDEYLGDYNEADYEDGISEEHKENENDRTPTFISSSKTFIVKEGDAIKLPCVVDNLENFLIIWKRGNQIITLGDKPYEDDDRRVQVENIWKSGNKILASSNKPSEDEDSWVQVGNTLVILLSEEKDAGDYVCQVSSAQPVELKHTVKIIVRPVIKSVPESGLLTVNVGEAADLSCKVTRGDPEPEVFWKRKDQPMPDGKESLSAPSITFPETSRHHSGLYTCFADNGWRLPATATIHLDVQHAPEIEQEVMMVENKDETEVRMICTVHASPIAMVEWYKDGQLMVVKNNVISKRGNRHTLLLTSITEEVKTAKFECRARNDIGETSAVLETPFGATEDMEISPENKIFIPKSVDKVITILKENLEVSEDAVLDLEEHDRTQNSQDTIKILLPQKTDEIDVEKENVRSEESEAADKINKDLSDPDQNTQVISEVIEDDSSLSATNLDDLAADANADSFEAENINKATEMPKVAKGEENAKSQEVANPEKLRDVPESSSSVQFLENFYLYLILLVICTLGL